MTLGAVSDLSTVNELYLRTRKTLLDAGIPMPELEARELVGKAVLLKASEIASQGYKYASEAASDRLRSLVDCRLSGTPLAHLLGEWDFLRLTLKITPDVLIPRSDTETLALATIERCTEAGPEPRLLDLCCGSGCVGLAVASSLPGARITFCDISEDAMRVTRENCRNFPGIYNFVIADALASPPTALRGFDAIACNPPYLTDAEWEALDREVKDHEPKLALAGGKDGLIFYRSVTAYWRGCLGKNGSLLFEVGCSQAGIVSDIMSAAGFVDVVKLHDLSGIERVVAGRAEAGALCPERQCDSHE